MIDLLVVSIILTSSLLMLATNRFPADTILLGALCLLLLSDILTPAEALAGLSNPGIATIAILYMVVSGLRETGTIARLIRLLLPAATISVFINNTPVVAMFISAVQDWCKRSSFKPSHFLLPLSYASILGGTCSLIGTSTI